MEAGAEGAAWLARGLSDPSVPSPYLSQVITHERKAASCLGGKRRLRENSSNSGGGWW